MHTTYASDGKYQRGRRRVLNAKYRNYDRWHGKYWMRIPRELEEPFRSRRFALWLRDLRRRKAPTETGYGVAYEHYTPERTYR
jgi:hypothetical protein